MPAHIPISRLFHDKAKALATEMASWESKPRLDEETSERIQEAIVPFPHTNQAETFRIAGVDGSGDYPSFTYADAFVYVATASGTMFRTDALHGLAEVQVLARAKPRVGVAS
ncbi:MAG: hypothetical protein R3F19_12085 [Verrucomicrobiales bacterium]